MILTSSEILKEIENSKITIEPFNYLNLNPNSYNYTLGEKYIIIDDRNRTSISEQIFKTIPKEGLILKPGLLYLMHTNEVIGSNCYVTSLIGRSSLGRLGLFLEISADLGNLGDAHKWTLEIFCVQPIIIYSGMKIGQVSFWKPFGKIQYYSGDYNKYNYPKKSNFRNDFNRF